MRDPNRIPRILDKLKAIWQDQPDLRFWQLLAILDPNQVCNPNFQIEDDKTEKMFDNLYDQIEEIESRCEDCGKPEHERDGHYCKDGWK